MAPFPIRKYLSGSIILMILFKMDPLNHEIEWNNPEVNYA